MTNFPHNDKKMTKTRQKTMHFCRWQKLHFSRSIVIFLSFFCHFSKNFSKFFTFFRKLHQNDREMKKNDNASKKIKFLPPAKVQFFLSFFVIFLSFCGKFVIFLSFWCKFLKNSEKDRKILRKMTEK